MLPELVPSGIHVATSDEPGDPDELLDTEADAVAAADTGRREEFAAGRVCARAALAALGRPPVPISVGGRREPVWPDGVVGSITHCGRSAAAAVAAADRCGGIGIDLEANRPVPHGAAELATRPAEWAPLPPRAGVDWGAVLLSAREALFKAWWPRCRTWLDPLDVTVHLRVDDGSFAIDFIDHAAAETAERTGTTGVQGRFAWDAAHVATAVWLPPVASGG